MDAGAQAAARTRAARRAAALWLVFLATAILLNGTLPFAVGADVRAWTDSQAKRVLVHVVVYAGLFLVAPLVVVTGWRRARRPSFLLPLAAGAVAVALRPVAGVFAGAVVLVLAYLHRRFDLASAGIRSRGGAGDAAAVLLLGLGGLGVVLLGPGPHTLALGPALRAGAARLFTNPASTVENLFYFGFLAERLCHKRWMPVLIGLMYTAHEMTNPEYWYEGMSFVTTFVAVAVTAVVYAWRRSVVVVWLGDGLARALAALVAAA